MFGYIPQSSSAVATLRSNLGPKSNYCGSLSISHWNLNSISTHNFIKFSALRAYISINKLGNSDDDAVSVFIDFPSNSQRDASFHCISQDYSHADWDSLRDHLRDVPQEEIFKLSTSTASKFCEKVQVVIDVYISHRKYQVKPHLSPWFPAASAAAIFNRNPFFRLNQQNKSSESKVNLTKASNHCKSILKAAKLEYDYKTKQPITSQKLGS